MVLKGCTKLMFVFCIRFWSGGVADRLTQLSPRMGRKGFRRACLLCVLALPGLLTAQVGPDAVQPGGVNQTLKRGGQPAPAVSAVTLIPPVVRRPLSVDGGPTIKVVAFRVDGVSKGDIESVSIEAINALVETARIEGNEEFTFGQLQLVADQITDLYRSNGLILAQAFLPAQDVVNDIVVLRVMEGNMGSVVVEDNKRYASEDLQKPFRRLIGNAVNARAVETALLRITDLPGLSAFGVFQPGEEIGTADLALKVTEKLIDANFGFNNYGTEFTGVYQSLLDIFVNNPLGIGDQLQLGYQQSYRPKLSDFGYFSYQAPVFTSWTEGLSAGLGFSRNDFEVGGELKDFGISGVTEIYNMYLDKSWLRSRRANFATKLDFSRKQSKVFISGADLSQDVLAVASLEARFDFIDSVLGGGINQGFFTLHHGFGNVLASTQADDLPGSGRADSSGNKLGSGFNKGSFDFSRLQNVVPNHSLILHATGQFSDDLLPSLEQMAMGGPYSVRAYPQAEFLVDKGIFASIEWVMNAPGFSDKIAFENKTWGEILQLSIFVDHATGWVNDAVGEDQIEVTGAGMGLQMFIPANRLAAMINYMGSWVSMDWQLHIPGELSLRLDVAAPIGTRDPTNKEKPQTYFNLNYLY
ncbi:MAG: ShlB/FhaC/HecB family hemolysin secretion/activation protein [Immundisolibacteraceae bacterium]|nr:ShlB/FhaC/HecB family hemolysin secretion/activation protein [Immundisolibacteraceae bacterium]